MHPLLLTLGLVLAFVGYVIERQRTGFGRAKAVGLCLFAVGVILLFGEGGWWGLFGLVVPAVLIDQGIAAFRRR